MREYNINASLVRATEHLYDNNISAVQMKGSKGEWLRTTVGVRQGCLLSPSLFCLEEHDGRVSIGGRTLTNLLFVVDIDTVAEEKQKLEALVESLSAQGRKWRCVLKRLMTTSTSGIQGEIKVRGQKLGTVTSFNDLGAIVENEGS